jgi:hypothetical protein
VLHDLVSHFTVALGHRDLLLLEIENGASLRPAIAEIRSACHRTVDLEF